MDITIIATSCIKCYSFFHAGLVLGAGIPSHRRIRPPFSRNFHRWHLTVGQRASVGSQIAKLIAAQTPKATRGRPPTKVEPEDEPKTKPTDVPVREFKPRGSALVAEENLSQVEDRFPKTKKEIVEEAAQKVGSSVKAIERFDAIEKKIPGYPKKFGKAKSRCTKRARNSDRDRKNNCGLN